MTQKICIAGKNNIAVNVTKYLLNQFTDIEIYVVFNSNDDGHNGFQQSFKKFCQFNNRIKIVSLDEVYEFSDLIFISLEFDKIIKPHLFSSNQLFNIHFSLLPEYKGMYTSALPILHGKNYSGVTFHKIDKGIDTGDIIEQIKFEIDDRTTAEELYNLYINYGTDLVVKNLKKLFLKTYKSTIQSTCNSTYYSKYSIDYKNLKIDLKKTAFQIQRQINAFVFPAYQLPHVYGFPIYKSQILNEKSCNKIGTVISENKFYIDIATIDFDIRLYKDLRNELLNFAKEGNYDDLKQFIAAGYDIKQRSKEGWDIAIIAAFNDQFEFLNNLILYQNWDVNTINNNGTTLSMYLMTRASFGADISYFENFIQNNHVDLAQKDFNNKSIFDYALNYQNIDVIKILKPND